LLWRKEKLSPDRRQHRGAHPEDEQLFAVAQLHLLRKAMSELSWLLNRGYTMKASLKLVGDRHSLTERQRLAVSHAACTDVQREQRAARCLSAESIRDENLIIDGFNLIITTEAALGGGLLMLCRDRCIRDLSSVHGSYRAVAETEHALRLIGVALETLNPRAVRWLLDSPISNSGRLAQRIRELAARTGWRWSVEVVFNPDAEIISTNEIAITSDSTILDGAKRWINFNDYLIKHYLREAWIVDLNFD
jgi:hypothetical protein